mgnify:CR=1 FL=1
MVAQVLVGIKITHIDKTFSYKIPSFMKEQISVGSRVLVPFGKQKLEGFVLEIVNDYDDEGNPIWEIFCRVTEYDIYWTCKRGSKKEAKQAAAFCLLKYTILEYPQPK